MTSISNHHAWRRSLDHVRSGSRGASLVEYAILVALIALVCVVAVTFFGEETSGSFDSSGSSLTNAG